MRRAWAAGGVTAALVAGVLATAAGGPAAATVSDDLDDRPGDGAPADGAPADTVTPGAYIVVLDEGSTAADVAEVAEAADREGAEVGGTVDGVVDAVMVSDATAVVDVLADLPSVAYVEPDAVWRAADVTTQNGASWGLDRVDQIARPLNGTYRYAGTGAGVRAYIMDSGIRAGHSQFGGRVVGGYTTLSDGRGTDDCDGHGTAVAGIVGGATYGVAKQATLVPVRVLDCDGFTTVFEVLDALEWIAADAVAPAVVNMSLGGPRSLAVDTAVRNLVSSGIPVVAAAGNDGADACNGSPSGERAAITVGATDRNDRRPEWSDDGPCVDLFAPGVDVTSAGLASDTASVAVIGTSFSAPYVAGAAALLLGSDPGMTAPDVAAAIIGTSSPGLIANPIGTPAARPGTPNRLLRVALPSGFVPQPPLRIAEAVPVNGGTSVTVALPSQVPAGVTAVAVNVTVSATTATTYVSVCPAEVSSASCRTSSSVNAYPGRDVANLAMPLVGDARALRVYNNAGSARVSVDLVGWFVPAGGAELVAQPPDRDDDDRPRIGPGDSAVITLDSTPPGATAAAVRVTVADVTANTYLSVCPVAQPVSECSEQSTLNSRLRDIGNLAIVPIDADGRIRLFNNRGEVTALTDVVGFFVPEGGGARYTAMAPTRVLDRRAIGPAAALTESMAALVPTAATAVSANVTVAGASTTSFVSVCPAGTSVAACRGTSTVNPYPNVDTASTTIVATGPSAGLLYANNAGSSLLFTDVQGYFLP